MSILEAVLLAVIPAVFVALRIKLLDWMLDRFGAVRTYGGTLAFWVVLISALHVWPA
jgi:hypothetical protein